MGKSSGGGGRGGIPKTKIGHWMNAGKGNKRVGVIINAPEKIGGMTVHRVGARIKGTGVSVYYSPSNNEVYNSKYAVIHNTPAQQGATWDAIQAVLDK